MPSKNERNRDVMSKITIRMSTQQHNELKKRAKAANLSVNQYVIESSLGNAPRNDKILSELMGELCKLEVCLQRASDLKTLRNEVWDWRSRTIRMIGDDVWQR